MRNLKNLFLALSIALITFVSLQAQFTLHPDLKPFDRDCGCVVGKGEVYYADSDTIYTALVTAYSDSYVFQLMDDQLTQYYFIHYKDKEFLAYKNDIHLEELEGFVLNDEEKYGEHTYLSFISKNQRKAFVFQIDAMFIRALNKYGKFK